MTNQHSQSMKTNEIGIGRTKLYVALKAGKIEIRKIGHKSNFLASELRRYLEELPHNNARFNA